MRTDLGVMLLLSNSPVGVSFEENLTLYFRFPLTVVPSAGSVAPKMCDVSSGAKFLK